MEKKKGFVAQVDFRSQTPAILINWDAADDYYEAAFQPYGDDAEGCWFGAENTTCWD